MHDFSLAVHTENTEYPDPSNRVNRRTVLRGLVWAAPAVAVSTAAPMAAASGTFTITSSAVSGRAGDFYQIYVNFSVDDPATFPGASGDGLLTLSGSRSGAFMLTGGTANLIFPGDAFGEAAAYIVSPVPQADETFRATLSIPGYPSASTTDVGWTVPS